jgi:hypothetical protein
MKRRWDWLGAWAAVVVLAATVALALPAVGGTAGPPRAWAQVEPAATPAPTPTVPAATPTALTNPLPQPAPASQVEPTPQQADPAAVSTPAPDAQPTPATVPAAPPAETPPAAPAPATPAASESPAATATLGPTGPGAAPAPAAGSPGAADTAASPASPASVALPGEATAGPDRVLYADNFASPSSGWPVQSSDAATRRVGYANGEYYVARLPGSGGSPYVMREERFGDFLLQVDVRLVEPTADAFVFVDFRRQESGEHYSFVVAPDEGSFIVRRNTDREGATLLDWTRSAAIQRGSATNRLGVRAQGADVTLLVNGEEVGRARADELRDGGIGFGVGSLGDGPAEARFTNLVVATVD